MNDIKERHMKKVILAATVIAFLPFISGCMHWPRSGINGVFYTNTTSPVAVAIADQAPTKTGRACSTGLMGLFGSGDSTIDTARKLGGITKVGYIEEEFHQVFLGFY